MSPKEERSQGDSPRGTLAFKLNNSESVNSTSDYNDNLADIYEAKLTSKYQFLSTVFVSAVDTILLGMYRDLMFSF